jgi:mRNA-degrading endonuclease RelE of RelBE toxin-antitoxin system
MEFETLPEYDRDLKKLLKKYRTLTNDIEDVKKVLSIRPDAQPPFSFRIDGLGIESCVIKVKKIASDSFKGRGSNSGFRLIYAYFQETAKIVLVELYHKNDKENEDSERILSNFK